MKKEKKNPHITIFISLLIMIILFLCLIIASDNYQIKQLKQETYLFCEITNSQTEVIETTLPVYLNYVRSFNDTATNELLSDLEMPSKLNCENYK